MVYVVQEVADKNILPARAFGELHVLLPKGQVYKWDPSITKYLLEQLKTYNSKDFILAIGDPFLIGLVTAMVAYRNCGEFTMLKWDRQEKLYYPIQGRVWDSSTPGGIGG